MDAELRKRIIGIGFAATLVLGGAACGNDEAENQTGGDNDAEVEEDSGIDGMGGTDDEGTEEDGMDAGEGMGGTDDDGAKEESGTGDGMGGTDDDG